MFDVASRCEKQLAAIGVDSPAKLARKISDGDRDTRARVFAAFRNLQVLCGCQLLSVIALQQYVDCDTHSAPLSFRI
jgi:hypothetical protein